MAGKPVIWTIDDDPELLRVLERDLKRHYAENYRVLRADSGQAALDALQQLTLRDETVALFLVDQRMPRMTGVEFFEQAKTLFPDARRVLLTAYADTEAAIRAINTAHLDYYLTKPYDPPEERLYPILDDLLLDWQANYRPNYTGMRVVGHRWSADAHALKDFLARNRVPYRWIDIEGPAADADARRLLDSLGDNAGHKPIVLLEDGTRLDNPTIADLAEKIGLQMQPTKPFYDLLIVGGGPAGLAAAVYGASEGLSTVLIEKEAPGGQAGTSSRIENYLGFPNGITGADLAQRAVDQAKRLGTEVLTPQEVVKVRREDPYRIVTLGDGSEISCHALLIATGVAWRKMEAPGIEQFTGAGVYYGAAITEAKACADEDVFLVGGANSAGQAAMYFSKYARSVTMLVRGEGLAKSMSHYLIEQIDSTPNIKVCSHAVVQAVCGSDTCLESLTIADTETGVTQSVPASALFIFIGAEPRTDWLDGLVARDDKGFILAGPDLTPDGKRPAGWPLDRDPFLLETSVPGIFVAGDVRHNSSKRVAAGVGAGSIAVQFVHQYLSEVR